MWSSQYVIIILNYKMQLHEKDKYDLYVLYVTFPASVHVSGIYIKKTYHKNFIRYIFFFVSLIVTWFVFWKSILDFIVITI